MRATAAWRFLNRDASGAQNWIMCVPAHAAGTVTPNHAEWALGKLRIVTNLTHCD